VRITHTLEANPVTRIMSKEEFQESYFKNLEDLTYDRFFERGYSIEQINQEIMIFLEDEYKQYVKRQVEKILSIEI